MYTPPMNPSLRYRPFDALLSAIPGNHAASYAFRVWAEDEESAVDAVEARYREEILALATKYTADDAGALATKQAKALIQQTSISPPSTSGPGAARPGVGSKVTRKWSWPRSSDTSPTLSFQDVFVFLLRPALSGRRSRS